MFRLPLILTVLTLTAGAQRIPPPAGAATPAAPAQRAQLPVAPTVAPTIVANVDLVNVVFSVTDKHGNFVPGLTQANFRVLEDGRPQAIKFFSLENQLPLNLGLLLDTSRSEQRGLPKEQQLSDKFFAAQVTSRDQAFVIVFDSHSALIQDFTSNQAKLKAAVDGAHIGQGGESDPSQGGQASQGRGGRMARGGTRLWDALYLAGHDVMQAQTGHKALVVVTDGGENGSFYSDAGALHATLDADTTIYGIITGDSGSHGNFGHGRGGRGPDTAGGLARFKQIIASSGGRSFDAGKDMNAAFEEIGKELRNQYSLAYHSDNPARDGAFRTLTIEVTGVKDATVRARSGYYAPGG